MRVEGVLWAFPLHLRFPPLVVLLLGDPHLLEGAQGCQDGAPDPRPESPLSAVVRADHLQPHARWSLRGQIAVQPLREPLEAVKEMEHPVQNN